jgi:uncharacterized damage-inducible protein DinB
MADTEARHRLAMCLGQWQMKLEQLRAERQRAKGAERTEVAKRLGELHAAVAAAVREWNAGIDAYDDDPAHTTQKEFDEQMQLRTFEQRITADIEAWTQEGHGVG